MKTAIAQIAQKLINPDRRSTGDDGDVAELFDEGLASQIRDWSVFLTKRLNDLLNDLHPPGTGLHTMRCCRGGRNEKGRFARITFILEE